MADPVFSIGSSKRKRITRFNGNRCIFCEQKFTHKNSAKSPDLADLTSIINACTSRDDEVGRDIICHKEKISTGTVKVMYHMSCKSSYVSQYNIDYALERKSSTTNVGMVVGDGNNSPAHTRSMSGESGFNWKTHCFICTNECQPNKRYSKGMSCSIVSSAGHSNDDTLLTLVFRSWEIQLKMVGNRSLVGSSQRPCHKAAVPPNY